MTAGTDAITKGLGQEICRVFAANNPSLQVIHLMYLLRPTVSLQNEMIRQ